MITLITGVPGSGKTALAVSMLDGEKARPLLVDGIPELQIVHEPLPKLEEWTATVVDEAQASGHSLQFTFAPNSLVIIDEAQRFYRVRSATSKVPDHVAALETHRHRGLDFWLITQHPGLIDPNVRKLVSRHIHLRTSFMGRQLFEWAGLGDPDAAGSRAIAARRSYKLPKKVFGLYKSAEIHTRVRRRTPAYVYVFGFAVLSIIAASVYMWQSIESKLKPEKPVPPATAPARHEPASGATGAQDMGYVESYQPRVGGLPHTAPIYDHLTGVQVAPWPAACLIFRGVCSCATAGGVWLRSVEPAACAAIVADGYFMGRSPGAGPGVVGGARGGAGGGNGVSSPPTLGAPSQPAAPAPVQGAK